MPIMWKKSLYMWGLLVLTVPVFYVIGLVTIIKFLFGNSSDSKERRKALFLKEVLPDLRNVLKQSDTKKSLSSLVESYKKLIQKYEYFEEGKTSLLNAPVEVEVKPATVNTPREVEKPTRVTTPQVDIGKLWANWYSNNSINLLLYVGAFLIVASGAIFVGFQWGTIAGVIKASAFSLLTILFLICGLLFYRIKSIQSAGFTFISIAALLTPFNGVAWFNFHFGPQGYEAGSVWLVTSFVSIMLYFFLTFYLQKSVFTYIFALGILSLVLSVVNISHLRIEFYILGSVFAAFLLLFAGRAVRNTKDLNELLEPLSISAQVVLPISLVMGFLFALSRGVVLEYPTSLSLLLSSAFYVFSYTFNKKVGYLIAAQVIFPFSVYVFLRSSNIMSSQAFIIAQLVPLVYVLVRRFIKDRKEQALQTTNILAFGIGAMSFIVNLSSGTLLSLGVSAVLIVLVLHFILVYLIERKHVYFAIALLILPIALYCFLRAVGIAAVHTCMLIEILGILYIGLSYASKRSKEEESDVFLIAQLTVPIAMFLGALLSSISGNLSFGNFTIFTLLALVFYIISYFYTRIQAYFVASGVFLPVVIYFLFRFTGLTPLTCLNIIQIVGIGYMAASFYLQRKYQKEYLTVQTLANIILPSVAIVISVVALIQNSTLFIPQVVFSVFTGCIYYALSFVLTKNKSYLLMAELTSLWFVNVLLMWMGLEIFPALLSVNTVCVVYAGLSYVNRVKYPQVASITSAVSVVVPAFIFVLASYIFGISGQDIFYFALVPCVLSLFAFLTTKKIPYLAVHVLFEVITLYLFVYQVLTIQHKVEMLGVLYVLAFLLYYVLAFYNQKRTQLFDAFIAATVVNGALALILTQSASKVVSVAAFIEALVAFHYQIAHSKKNGIYLGGMLASLGVHFALKGWGIEKFFHPFAYQALFIFLYGAFCITRDKIYSKDLRILGITGSFVSVFVFWFLSKSAVDYSHSALATSYILTVLLAFDAWYVREKYFGYVASAVGMVTYFWQVHLLGYTEYQMFLLPLGVYLMVLSYFTRKEKNTDISKGLEYGGLFVLLVPLLFQSFGENGFYYSLILAMEGIALLILGVTFEKKIYRYVGIGAIVSAVFSQTYNYVFTLPRWVSTAAAGFTFIAVAIFLLLKRKDIEK